MMHQHRFERHILRKIVGGRFTAWIPLSALLAGPVTEPTAWKCVDCDEQGYEVPA